MTQERSSRRRILQASGVAIATALAGCGGGGDGDGGDEEDTVDADATVTLGEEPHYDPQTVEISVGQTVLWEVSTSDHFLSVSSAPEDGEWSGTGASAVSGDQTHSHTFEVAGTYEYSCNYHPSSTGVVEVSE